MPQTPAPVAPPQVDPQRFERTLNEALTHASTLDGVWVFGYASLIWRPEFEACDVRAAQLVGWHRALRVRSRLNRGTPERPGLVFSLFQGGTCRGMAYKVSPNRVRDDLTRLWSREMVMSVYDPRWLTCRTADGPVRALTFTLNRKHPSCTGTLSDEAMLDVLRHAQGRFGTTLDYLVQTHRGLLDVGICDPQIARLVALAQRDGLMPSDAVGVDQAAKPATPSPSYFNRLLDPSTA